MLLGQLAAAKGLSLRLRLAPTTPYRLRGGPRQLHQALVNLVGNAIKFTDRGRVVISGRARSARDGPEVGCDSAVEDTGVGLSPEAQAHLFERFARSDDSVRRGISGSGLGLNITRELVELMGGTVGMSSALGQGSTFWFELPLAVDRATRMSVPERLARAGGRDRRPGRGQPCSPSASQGFGCEARCVATAESAAELLRHADARPAVVVSRRDRRRSTWRRSRRCSATIAPVEPIDMIGGRHCRAMPAELHRPWPTCRLTRRRRPVRQPARRAAAAAGDAAVRACRCRPPVLERPDAACNVLVAEDNRTNQKVIGKILEHAGHRATIVATGQEAVEALEEPGYDLVLMDLNMPELGGIDAVKLLRFTHDVDELPPIVALSADATPQTREACRAVGFSAYLTKPVDTQLLLRTLAELTARRRTASTADPTVSRACQSCVARPTERRGGSRRIDTRRLASLAELDQRRRLSRRPDRRLPGRSRSDARRARSGRSGRARRAGLPRSGACPAQQCRPCRGARRCSTVCLGWRELDDHALLMRATVELTRLQREWRPRRGWRCTAFTACSWRLARLAVTGRRG